MALEPFRRGNPPELSPGKQAESEAASASVVRSKTAAAGTIKELKHKPWSVFFYLCADNHLDNDCDRLVEELADCGDLPNVHVVVQCDRLRGPLRFIAQPHPRSTKNSLLSDPSFRRSSVDTGEPDELSNFLEWGLQHAPCDHVAIVLFGLGMNPSWVLKYHRDGLDAPDNKSRAVVVQQRLFSICHDQTAGSSLDVTQLRLALRDVQKYLADQQSSTKIEMVLSNMGSTAFIETLFELEGLASVFFGSHNSLPDVPWPFKKIVKHLDQHPSVTDSAGNEEDTQKRYRHVHSLARKFVRFIDTDYQVKSVKRAPWDERSIVAVNLEMLSEVARTLDALTSALLQSLGDWHVLQAVKEAMKTTPRTDVEPPRTNLFDNKNANDYRKWYLDQLPAVDLFRLLENLQGAFQAKRDAGNVPVEFRQRERIENLADLTEKARSILGGDLAPFILGNDLKERERIDGGLSIYLPPLRNHEQIDNETGPRFSLESSIYSRLRFSARVHWSAFVGAFQLIEESPHALWRVVSSMLGDASGPSRDAALGRIVGENSVVTSLRDQFRSLDVGRAHTLSFEPVAAAPLLGQTSDGATTDAPESDFETYIVRLESALGGGTIIQQESRISRVTLKRVLTELNKIVTNGVDRFVPVGSRYVSVGSRLESLGRTLGEDLIQDLANALRLIARNTNDGSAPHLTLQMPRSLMQYPWELLHDKDGLISERFAIGRQFFMESQFVRQTPQRAGNSIRAVVIADPTFSSIGQEHYKRRGWNVNQLESARHEGQTVNSAWRRLQAQLRGVIEIEIDDRVGEEVTADHVRELLRGGCDLMHFAGHSYFDPIEPDRSGWLLSNGILTAREIRNTLAWEQSPPWLVYANACESAMDSESPQRPGPQDVSGLATAFVAQGVAAYIAPLWKIEDHFAEWIATRFYEELLLGRFTVGESLRRAKMSVWRELLGRSNKKSHVEPELGWTGTILYGDPTTRLLQSLWIPNCRSETSVKSNFDSEIARPVLESSSTSRSITLKSPSAVADASTVDRRVLRQLPRGQLGRLIRVPAELLYEVPPNNDIVLNKQTLKEISSDRSDNSIDDGQDHRAEDGLAAFRLVDRKGVRFWQFHRPGDPCWSENPALVPEWGTMRLADRLQVVLPPAQMGLDDDYHVLRTWLLHPQTNGVSSDRIREVARLYDQSVVETQGIWMLERSGGARRIVETSKVIDQPPNTAARKKGRALIFLPGVFSNCEASLADWERTLAEEDRSLLQWAKEEYGYLLAFDHWSLSNTPLENAELLKRLLGKFPSLVAMKKSIDIVGHGRGGLVATALANLLDNPDDHRNSMIDKILLVGAPISQTLVPEACPWGTLADLLINMGQIDSTGLYTRLSGLLMYLIAVELDGALPGFAASVSQVVPGKSRGRTKPKMPKGTENHVISYGVIAANYIPRRSQFNFITLLAELGVEGGKPFFKGANDLFVDLKNMWTLDDQHAATGLNIGFNPSNVLYIDADEKAKVPEGVIPLRNTGVHHTNYFGQIAVRDFLRNFLIGKTKKP